MSTSRPADAGVTDKQRQILDAVVAVVVREGIAGVSMRAVAREAGVALGLINYYYTDKTSLIAAALRRIGSEDLAILSPDDGLDPDQQLRHALRAVATEDFLRSDYLTKRLQLWSLASVNDLFAEINHKAQAAYLDGLARLIAESRPELNPSETHAKAADILVIQNGIWLTSALVTEPEAIERSIERCEAIAFA